MTPRESFEQNYLCNNKQAGRRNEHGDYVLPSIQDAFAGWNAAYAITEEYLGNAVAEAMRKRETVEKLVALVSMIISDKQLRYNNMTHGVIKDRLEKILEAGR